MSTEDLKKEIQRLQTENTRLQEENAHLLLENKALKLVEEEAESKKVPVPSEKDRTFTAEVNGEKKKFIFTAVDQVFVSGKKTPVADILKDAKQLQTMVDNENPYIKPVTS